MTSSAPVPTMPTLPSPEFLPQLAVGRHRRPRDGACLMEYVSVLAGLPFSDRPSCTDPALAMLAHLVNDMTSDAGRPQLALLAPDLIGTRDSARVPNVAATVVLAVTAAGLRWAPHDAVMRKLHGRAIDRHLAGGGRWRSALGLATTALLRHMRGLDDASRDRCLFVVLQRVARECRTGLVVTDTRPLIDRIDRRNRSAR